MSCRCLEPRWFVGDPISLARDNIISAFSFLPVFFECVIELDIKLTNSDQPVYDYLISGAFMTKALHTRKIEYPEAK